MHGFKGTWRLVWLALRRDRIKLTAWVAGIIVLGFMLTPILYDTYGQPEQRAMYTQGMSVSMMGRMFGGLMDDSSFGSILMIESFLFITALMAFMSVQVITRHTRFNEEMGSSELMQSELVGRFAGLNAALIVAVMANVAITVTLGVVMSNYNYFSSADVWLMCLAMGGIGISFAAIAAVIVQLSESTHTCNVLAGVTIGICFLLRALGDGFAPYADVGVKVDSLWLSWLSPIGWGQQTFPFTRHNWWVLGLFVVFSLLCMAISYLILKKRDVGSGVWQERQGQGRASKLLLSPVGLAWRLHRNTLFVWAVSVVCLGIIYGIMSEQFKELIGSNDFWIQFVGVTGGQANYVDTFNGAIMSLMMMCCAVPFVIQILQKLRSEESSGFAESILTTSVSRFRWLFSHLLIAIVGAIFVAVLFALGFGISFQIITQADWSVTGDFVIAALTYLPAVVVYIGLIIATFGILPTLTVPIAWSVLIVTLVISQLGTALKLPQWLMDASPFSHVSNYLLEDVKILPLAVMTAISVGLIIIGYAAFKRRNLAR